MATPCPGTQGCKCPWCHGLAEYALEHLGTDYGLPRTWKPVTLAPAPLRPASEPTRPATPSQAPQPWEPRPSRRQLAA